MTRYGFGCAKLRDEVRTMTPKAFGVSFSGFDWLLLVCCGLFAVGEAWSVVRRESFALQMTSIAIGTVCTLSVFLAYRMMVPFALRIAQADLLRVRRPFYVWLCCGVFIVCTSNPFLKLFSDQLDSFVQVFLTILSAGLAIEHFRRGRMRYLFLSASVVGVVIGLSAFGICALALLILISLLVRRMLWSELEHGDDSADASWVFERLISPTALSGVRFVMAVCLFLGAAASIAWKVCESGTGVQYLVDRFPHEWLSGLSPDGIAVLALLGLIPLLAVLSQVRAATDTMRLFNFVEQFKYFMVVCGIGGFLLWGDGILRRMQIPVHADARYWVLSTALGGFAFLVAVMILLVDSWCRIPKNVWKGRAGRKNPVSRFCQLVLVAVPVALVGVMAFLRARLAMGA